MAVLFIASGQFRGVAAEPAEASAGDPSQSSREKEMIRQFAKLSRDLEGLPEPPAAEGRLVIMDGAGFAEEAGSVVGAVEHEQGADREEDVTRPGT